MITIRRIARGLPVAVLASLVLVPSAFAQATRTWVSGVGDDANPCSRTAPCKTFAGAISKTAAGGEIDTLDPGGFGALTITKSITIDAYSGQGGVLVSGTNGFVINAPGANVILRYLDFDGLRDAGSVAGDGIQIVAAKSVTIADSRIFGFPYNGVNFEPSAGGVRLYLFNDQITNNGGNGLLIDAPSGGSGLATLTNDEIDQNACGVTASSTGGTTAFGTLCGAGSATGGAAVTNVFNSTISGSAQTPSATGTGILANGATATQQISGNRIGLNTVGLQVANGGKINSWGNNYLGGNGTNGAPTGTLSPMFRRSAF